MSSLAETLLRLRPAPATERTDEFQARIAASGTTHGAYELCLDHARALERDLIHAEATAGAAEFCCMTCGSTGPFSNVTYPSTPDGPEEYDIKCDACGSLEVAESITEVVSAWKEKLDDSAEDAEAESQAKGVRDYFAEAAKELALTQEEIRDLGIGLGQCAIRHGIPALRKQRDELRASIVSLKASVSLLVPLMEAVAREHDGYFADSLPCCGKSHAEGYAQATRHWRDKINAIIAIPSAPVAAIRQAQAALAACADAMPPGEAVFRAVGRNHPPANALAKAMELTADALDALNAAFGRERS